MSFRVALALGGGAARGLAHLGVIKALQEAKIPIDIVSGASIGGVIGAAYASHPDIESTIEQIQEYLGSERFNQTRLTMIKESEAEAKSYYSKLIKFVKGSIFWAISSTQQSFITKDVLQDNLEHVVPKIKMEDCAIPLGLSATDLRTGREIHLTQGSLVHAVMASCAIPGIFPPIEHEGRLLVDGSWVHPIPVSFAKQMGADFVIAVDVAPAMSLDEKEYTGLGVNLRSSEATRLALKNYNVKEADYVISVDAMGLHWADFTKLDFCVETGHREAERHIQQLQWEIAKKKVKSFFW